MYKKTVVLDMAHVRFPSFTPLFPPLPLYYLCIDDHRFSAGLPLLRRHEIRPLSPLLLPSPLAASSEWQRSIWQDHAGAARWGGAWPAGRPAGEMDLEELESLDLAEYWATTGEVGVVATPSIQLRRGRGKSRASCCGLPSLSATPSSLLVACGCGG